LVHPKPITLAVYPAWVARVNSLCRRNARAEQWLRAGADRSFRLFNCFSLQCLKIQEAAGESGQGV
jgi:hypothetical protein